MSFLTAAALLVALLVGAPLAAHMLRRRRADERVFPPAGLVPPTPPAARRRSHLEDRALLSIRALSVIALAVLGATPLIRCSRLSLSRKAGANVALAIIVDDSLSMRAPAGTSSKTRFERARQGARELAQNLHAGDAAAIVLAGAPARVVLASTTNTAAINAAIDALEPSDRGTDLDAAIHLSQDLLKGLVQADKRIVVLSDLADGAPGEAALSSEGENQLWAPLAELEGDLPDCAVIRADRSGRKVHARVVCSQAAPERSIEVRSAGKVIRAAALKPNARADDVSFELPPDAPEHLYVALTGADAIAEDDIAPVITEGGSLSIAVVVDTTSTHVATGGPPPIEQAFAALELDTQVRPLPSVPEHADELNTFAGIIVDDAPGFTPEARRSLAAWVQRGGVALLTLGPRAAAAPLGAGFEQLIPGVVRWGESPSPGIDASTAPYFGPSARGFAELNPRGRASLDPAATEDAGVLARWTDGAPFLVRRAIGRGAVLALTLPLSTDESDLALRPAFLALLDRFASTTRARGGARRIDVGETWTFDGFNDVKVERVSFAGPGERKPVKVTDLKDDTRDEGDRSSMAALGSDRRISASPPLAGLYELSLDGETSTRAAQVPEREVDLRPRKVAPSARTEALGGMAAAVDVSPYVALSLLALLAAELLLRTLSQRSERPEGDMNARTAP